MAIWSVGDGGDPVLTGSGPVQTGSGPVQTGSSHFFVSREESSRRRVTAMKRDASLCQTLTSHLSDVNSVAFIDDDAFVSCSGDKTVRLWRRRREGDIWQECDVTASRPLSRHAYGVTSASFCGVTGYLAVASLDGKITIWDTKVSETSTCCLYFKPLSINFQENLQRSLDKLTCFHHTNLNNNN